ncbi:site-specific DNA-methyltransferase, partial [Candidatus Parcubacteria bacterium]
ITFDEERGQQALDLFGDEYLLRYMLKWETKKSETFLDVAQLQTPFSYKLRIHRDGQTREQSVDLPETFNYLLGLDVETRQVIYSSAGDAVVTPTPGNAVVSTAPNPGKKYLVYRGTTRDGRKVAVIWRETKGWIKADYERDAAFVAEQELAAGADEVFVNGDSCIPGARSLDGIFKARLFGQEG